MKTEMSFDELCRMLKAGSSDRDVVNALDTLSGALMVLAPSVVGVPAASVFGLIGAKNEVVKVGRFLLGKLTGRPADDRLTRHDLLLTAYCLSCYTAFFEAVDRLFPEIDEYLLPEDRVRLTNLALDEIALDGASSLARHRIALPHPNDLVEESAEQLDRLYTEMAVGFDRLVRDFAMWDDAGESARDHLLATIRQVPDLAKDLYRGQYLALCVDFPEFSAWANLQEHALTRKDVAQVAADVRVVLELLRAGPDGIDIGLASLGSALTRVAPDSLDEVLNGLGLAYRAAIDLPVIDDTYAGSDGVDLRYPRKSEIFVPQAFRALRYGKSGGQLEHEAMWEHRRVQHDIGRYVLSHLASPYSLETPLVVLGQPGSGKSLLTEFLAARLASAEYHPVRVELRDINPDSDIQDQIEEQIRADTGHDVNWAELSTRCDRPPLVILDGYDELLQASGKVFSTYLRQVANFQRREQVQGRPVRVVVTSRVTLIDKAVIPVGSAVVRLEEFDAERQGAWTDIWNQVNQPYFASHGIRPFELPEHGNVRDLATQPLLLLMLALYDSDGNRLSNDQDLDQTVLYHNLLIRFITRERHKGEDGERFRALSPAERADLIGNDLKRLSVAAIGMVNRRALHISKSDLDQDISYFGLSRGNGSTSGVGLGQAELLLGSFFFVHESRSRLRGDGLPSEGPAAFEFLHNTFGEFLAAEWLMTSVLAETEVPWLMRTQPGLQQRLGERIALRDEWFATLMATPLFTRPVVLEMLRQWSAHRLRELGRDLADFTTDLETILYSQLRRVLSDAEPPTMLLTGRTPFPRASALANMATYTLNLVLLRCVTGGPWLVDLDRLRSDAFPKPWTNLIDLWRTGLGRDGLQGVSTILTAAVDGDGTRLTARDTFTSSAADDHLRELYELAKAIGDDQLEALTGWALQDAQPSSPPPLPQLADLPAIAGTAFSNEIRARHLLRERAAHGALDPIPDWLLNGTSTTSGFILASTGPSSGGDEGFDFAAANDLNAELAVTLWNTRRPTLAFKTDDDSVLELVVNQSTLAAHLIAWGRDLRAIRVGVANMLPLPDKITDAAAALATESPEALSAEVLYELITVDRAPHSTVTSLLGASADVWALAYRPRSTVLCLLRLSERLDTWDWVRVMVSELRDTNLAEEVGPATALILVRQLLVLDARDELDVRANWPLYSEIVTTAIRYMMPEDHRSTAEGLLALVNLWRNLDPARIDGRLAEFARQAIEMSIDIRGELSEAAARDLRALEEWQEPGDL